MYKIYLEYLLRKNTQSKINKLSKKYKNKKVMLYGAGIFFEILNTNFDLSELNIIGLVDKKFAYDGIYQNYSTYTPESFLLQKPDVILYTVLDSKNLLEFFEKELFPKYGKVKTENIIEHNLTDFSIILNLCKEIISILFYQIARKKSIELEYPFSELEEMKICLENTKTKFAKPNILFFSAALSFDKGICNYLEKIQEYFPYKNLILMNEFERLNQQKIYQKLKLDNIINMPQFLRKGFVKENINLKLNKTIYKKLKNNKYLSCAVQNIRGRHINNNLGINYPEFVVYFSELYINKVLDILKPEAVILWNQFYNLHYIINEICKKRGIKVYYMEFGSIPGTFAFEEMGQMGESFSAVNNQIFLELEVNENELKQTEKILDYLKVSKLNRNAQAEDTYELIALKQSIKAERPTIFYAGQNDFESGMYPYTEHTKKYHSPIFKNSEEPLTVLSKLATKYDWNLVFKQHPIMADFTKIDLSKYPNVHTVHEIDINDIIDLSDVTITILSQVSYIALIREKPVLMLGYTQLKHKNCSYEAFNEEDIEKNLVDAVQKGYTESQKQAFKKHCAQMLKYCQYDDLQEKEIIIGQSFEILMKKFFETENNNTYI